MGFMGISQRGGDVGGERGKSYKRGEQAGDGDVGEEEERSPSV